MLLRLSSNLRSKESFMETVIQEIDKREEFYWEILQENEMNKAIFRYWFKQNFLIISRENRTQTTYH